MVKFVFTQARPSLSLLIIFNCEKALSRWPLDMGIHKSSSTTKRIVVHFLACGALKSFHHITSWTMFRYCLAWSKRLSHSFFTKEQSTFACHSEPCIGTPQCFMPDSGILASLSSMCCKNGQCMCQQISALYLYTLMQAPLNSIYVFSKVRLQVRMLEPLVAV